MSNHEPTDDNGPALVDMCGQCEKREGTFMCACGDLVCHDCTAGTQCQQCWEDKAYEEDLVLDDFDYDPIEFDDEIEDLDFDWQL